MTAVASTRVGARHGTRPQTLKTRRSLTWLYITPDGTVRRLPALFVLAALVTGPYLQVHWTGKYGLFEAMRVLDGLYMVLAVLVLFADMFGVFFTVWCLIAVVGRLPKEGEYHLNATIRNRKRWLLGSLTLAAFMAGVPTLINHSQF